MNEENIDNGNIPTSTITAPDSKVDNAATPVDAQPQPQAPVPSPKKAKTKPKKAKKPVAKVKKAKKQSNAPVGRPFYKAAFPTTPTWTFNDLLSLNTSDNKARVVTLRKALARAIEAGQVEQTDEVIPAPSGKGRRRFLYRSTPKFVSCTTTIAMASPPADSQPQAETPQPVPVETVAA